MAALARQQEGPLEWLVGAASRSAYLGDVAVAKMFRGPRFPVVAGQGTRQGKPVRDGDGYRLSGAWSFAPGIKHAQWIHPLGIVEETGEPLILMQRYFRDVHAGTQHVTSAPGVIEACGRHLGGLAPAHDWLHMDLVSKAS